MKLTIEGSRMFPEWVLEFVGMGKGPDLPAFLCTDSFGRHVTIIGFDEDHFHTIHDSTENHEGRDIPVAKYPVSLMGWPEG